MHTDSQKIVDSTPAVTLTVGQLRELVRQEVERALCAGMQPAEVQPAAPAKPFLTIREAAELARIAPSTLRLYIRKGHLKPRKVGRRIIIARAELERFLGSPSSNVVELYSI